MKIVDPQAATLTNVEVLSYFTSNPPRKSPEGPPGQRNYEPKPDLRSHCTVVTEFHGYVERTCPHLLNYPRYTHPSVNQTQPILQQPSTDHQEPYVQPKEPTPFENALRTAIKELAPFGLTKGEVMMLVNLGIGLNGGPAKNKDDRDNDMDVDENEEQQEQDAELPEEVYWYHDAAALATVVEDMDARLAPGDNYEILRIMERIFKKRE